MVRIKVKPTVRQKDAKDKPFTRGTFKIKGVVKGLTPEASPSGGTSLPGHKVLFNVYKDRRKKKGTVADRKK